MTGWASPNVFDTYSLTGRITRVGLYLKYIERHMRAEMELMETYSLAVAQKMPEGLREPATYMALWF
jgi:hypothetical protein